MQHLNSEAIQAGIHAVLQPRKKLYPVHVNRISALDEPCLRRLFYMRASWDKQGERDDGFQGILETGSILEPILERIASEVGQASPVKWRIIGNQMPTRSDLLSQYQVSGTIDGLLQVQGE